VSDDVVELVVVSDERFGAGGFLEVRRVRLRNRRGDGSLSGEYISDSVARDSQDAVVVAVYARTPEIQVLLRDGLRPALVFGRDASRAPLPESPPALFLTELVAGVLERGDVGEAGLLRRAREEVLEEAGFAVAPDQIAVLGPGMFASPGCFVEKFYFACVEVDPSAQRPLAGDGSPMEEGARTRWVPLDDAIAACMAGEISDLKTELGLRRLRDHLRR
jgi:8-oxo-dGTP pyrophosphatase MutT (NUDIX family)